METFVVQIRTHIEGRPERTGKTSPDELQGVVEHVGTGRRQPFAGTPELLAFLRAKYPDVPKEAER